MKYSKSTGGFYSELIHTPAQIPSDAVDITDADHAALLAGQSAGKVIDADANGHPFLRPPYPPALADVKTAKLSDLALSRDAATSVNVTVNGKVISADQATQTGIKRLGDRMRRGKPTTLHGLIDSSGNAISPVTQALLDAYEDAVAANTESAWNHYGQLVAQVNAAPDAATVNAITW